MKPPSLNVRRIALAISADRLPPGPAKALRAAVATAQAQLAPKAKPKDDPSRGAPDPTTLTSGESMARGARGRQLDELFRAYGHLGGDAVDRAAKFAREHAQLVAHSLTTLTEARYVAINMAKTLAAK